jgi:hypothetical protein
MQFRRQSQGSAGHLRPPRGTYAPYLTVFSRNRQHSRPIHPQPRLLYQPDQVTPSRSLDFEPPPFLLSCELNVTIRPFNVRHPIQSVRTQRASSVNEPPEAPQPHELSQLQRVITPQPWTRFKKQLNISNRVRLEIISRTRKSQKYSELIERRCRGGTRAHNNPGAQRQPNIDEISTHNKRMSLLAS